MKGDTLWVYWCCTQCKKLRYSTAFWARLGAPHCHHGYRMNIGTELNPIPLSFNPVEEKWYGGH